MSDDASRAPERGLLDTTRITSAFAADPALTVEVVTQVASTNEVAAQRARDGAHEGLLVVADHQAAGRGRLDRTWVSPPGTSVTFSLLLRPTAPAAAWPWIPLLVGHNVAKALTALGVDARVKWPNDVLIEDRKVAGILVERIETPTGPAAVVGVGINVAMTPEELPVDTATSLAIARGTAPDREDVLFQVATTLREGFDVWQAGGDLASERLAASYRAGCATLGRAVRVDLPGGGVLTGTAVDVDAAGRLVVETADGTERVGAGDVVHVRPVDPA